MKFNPFGIERNLFVIGVLTESPLFIGITKLFIVVGCGWASTNSAWLAQPLYSFFTDRLGLFTLVGVCNPDRRYTAAVRQGPYKAIGF